MESLWAIRLAVKYYDNYVKCQTWGRNFIEQTESLVFSTDLMDEPEKKWFLPQRDWRDNPCLVRYRVGDQHPEPICQRGKEFGPKVRKSKERGHPLAIEFQLKDNGGTVLTYCCDADWIFSTAELVFQHDLQVGNYPTEPVIRRTTLDGDKSILDIQKVLMLRELGLSSISTDSDGRPDPIPCGFRSVNKGHWI
jgi:hypothetical protein